jgi:imidazolonepropionase-like amidohydrolase
VIEEGHDELGPMPTLDGATVKAIVAAAHARDLLVITHVHSRAAARTAIEADTDGLTHMFADAPPTDELIDLAVERDVFVIGTLPVMEHKGDDAPPESTIAEAGVAILAGSDAPNPGTA